MSEPTREAIAALAEGLREEGYRVALAAPDFRSAAEGILRALPEGWRLALDEEPSEPITARPERYFVLRDAPVIDGLAELPDGRIVEAPPGVEAIRYAIIREEP